MLCEQILQSIECAIAHKCPKDGDGIKRCAECDIGYSFVAYEPQMLDCGHHICNEFKNSETEKDLTCKICDKSVKLIAGRGFAADSLFQVLSSDLAKELKEKYAAAIHLYKETKSNDEREAKIAKIKQSIKQEIDLKVELLSEKINKLKNVLYDDVERICNNALTDIKKDEDNSAKFSEHLKELEECVQKCEIEKEKFFIIQKSLKEIINEIQNIFDFDFQLNFKPSNSDLLNAIGELEVKNFKNKKQVKPFNKINLDMHVFSILNDSNIRALALLNNGDLASSSIDDKTVKIWSSLDYSLKNIIFGHDGPIYALAAHPNGNFISGSKDKTIKIWSIDGELVNTLTGHNDDVWALAVLKNSDIASGSADATIKIWSEKGESKYSFAASQIGIRKLAAHPNGDLVSVSADTIKIWSSDGNLKFTLLAHLDDVLGLAVFANGDIVSGSRDRTVKIWNEQGELKNTLTYHSSFVCGVAALPNGDIASASYVGKIIISDTIGKVKLSFDSHGKCNLIWNLVANPNGELIVANSIVH